MGRRRKCLRTLTLLAWIWTWSVLLPALALLQRRVLLAVVLLLASVLFRFLLSALANHACERASAVLGCFVAYSCSATRPSVVEQEGGRVLLLPLVDALFSTGRAALRARRLAREIHRVERLGAASTERRS